MPRPKQLDETKLRIVERISNDDKLAYRPGNAAKALDISWDTLRREVKRGKIHPTRTLGLITKDELLRYLQEETTVVKKRGRPIGPLVIRV